MPSKTRAERREQKKRKRMPVTGKHVFVLKRLAAQQPATGVKRRGNKGRHSLSHATRINKPARGNH